MLKTRQLREEDIGQKLLLHDDIHGLVAKFNGHTETFRLAKRWGDDSIISYCVGNDEAPLLVVYYASDGTPKYLCQADKKFFHNRGEDQFQCFDEQLREAGL